MTNQTLIEDLTLVHVPQWWENPWVWAGVAVAVFAMIYFGRRWIRSRPVPLKPAIVELPGAAAHVEALKRLEELRARHAKLTAYEVAIECSDILRRYIERRFTSPIRFQTTREFLGAIHASPELSGESRDELGAFLNFFDGIKFAQEGAEAARTAGAIDGAERFVRRCIPVENVPAQ